MRAALIVLFLLVGCNPPTGMSDWVEEWECEDRNMSVYLTWDAVTEYVGGAAIPAESPAGYKVYFGRVSKDAPEFDRYEFECDAGRISGYIVPPVLTGPARWYFVATSYELECRDKESSYSNEVSKFVE